MQLLFKATYVKIIMLFSNIGGAFWVVFLQVLLVVVSLVLIGAILLQSGEGSGLGALTGGGAAQSLGGSGKALDKLLSKVTIVSAVLFMLLALIIAAI